MRTFQPFVGQQVIVEISGNNICAGKLIDLGLDIMVMLNEQQFYYIPLVHVQNVKLKSETSRGADIPTVEMPIDYQVDSLSFRKILNTAKGRFVEIYVTGNKTIHGYLTSIMNDYFVFYSPVYKAMFVSMNHLKWLIPYQSNLTPFSLNNQFLPMSTINITLSRTFEEQCKKLEGKLVVFDLGDNTNKIGLLQKADSDFIQLINASGDNVLWNLHHLKTVYTP
jgi:small nuclear ribonucleoprotein (snRNP)-like protein